MFRHSLYTVDGKQSTSGQIIASFTLNGDHPLFEGHFPGSPILPGVCSLQISKEILEDEIDLKLTLETINNQKFLNIISPHAVGSLELEIVFEQMANRSIKLKAFIRDSHKDYYKFSGSYKIAE